MTNRKEQFSNWLRNRFFLRFHMSIIVVSTFLTGLIATKILLELNVNRLWFRYAVAVFLAYGAFLLFIRVWLWYVGTLARSARADLDASAELLEDLSNLADALDLDPTPALQSEGGEFGGGGASGSYDASPHSAMSSGSSSHDIAQPTSSFNGGGFSIDGDDVILVILFVIFVLSLFLTGGYLIYAAPGILTEAAFEAVLAAALIRRAKRVDTPGWVGSIFKATAFPFFAILGLTVVLGWYAQYHCPAAIRIRDAIACTAPR